MIAVASHVPPENGLKNMGHGLIEACFPWSEIFIYLFAFFVLFYLLYICELFAVLIIQL